jgi:copper oxidase (laccase) domain-containing protein
MPEYQPITTFPEGIRAAFSDVSDGSMAAGGGLLPTELHRKNADHFLESVGIRRDCRTRIHVTYAEGRVYDEVVRVDKDNCDQSIETDAIFTTEIGQALTLPVADCVATIVYDPTVKMLGMLHLGRHSSVDGLIESFAKKVMAETGSDPNDWHVWMSPSLQKAHNTLQYFSPPSMEEWHDFASRDESGEFYIDMEGHNEERFKKLGVQAVRIAVSGIDTYEDSRYFSHRAATEPNGDMSRQGRMMAAAVLLDI